MGYLRGNDMGYLGVGSLWIDRVIEGQFSWWTNEPGLTLPDDNDDGYREPTVTAKPLVLNVPAKKQATASAAPEPTTPSDGSMVVPLLLGLGALLIFTGTLKL